MVNYGNSIIYKLCCKDTNITDIYVGSTTNFYRRKQEHKNRCNNDNVKSYNMNVYKFIRNNGSWNNWDMIEIEKYNATDKRNLEKIERYWIETLKPSLNKNIPIRSYAEKIQLKKIYNFKNKDKFKEYYQKNKEKKEEYYQQNKEQKKEYQLKNKDKIKEYNRQYYLKKKEQKQSLEIKE